MINYNKRVQKQKLFLKDVTENCCEKNELH